MDFAKPMDRLLCPGYSPGKNIRVGIHSLFQGIFPKQGLNLGLLNYRQILYQTNKYMLKKIDVIRLGL